MELDDPCMDDPCAACMALDDPCVACMALDCMALDDPCTAAMDDKVEALLLWARKLFSSLEVKL